MTCSMGSARWFWADGHAWSSAAEACACQHCAGHRWTFCSECGRAGDRGDDRTDRHTCEQFAPDCPSHSTPSYRYIGGWAGGMFIYGGCGCMARYVQNCLVWGRLDGAPCISQDGR